MDRLRRGVALLQRNDVAAGALMALDFASWFPVFLDIPAVPGRLWCFHPGRSISRATAPPAAEMFAGVRQIMVPKTHTPPKMSPTARDFLLDLYWEHIAHGYILLDENEEWWLLAATPAHATRRDNRNARIWRTNGLG